MAHKEYTNQVDSEIKWVGKIPSHWEISKFKNEFVFSKSTNTSKNPTILSLTLQGIKIRDITTNDGQIASSYDNYTKVYKGDIVLNPMDLISGFVDCSPVEGVISPAYYTLKPNQDVDPEYYKYYLQKHYYEQIFFPFAEGVSVDHRWTLKKEDFLNFGLIKPPLEEQKQIANYLDQKTAKIDATIAKNEELIQLLEEKRVALINQVVTKGLNPDVSMKDSGVEWIGEIPEHWDVINLKKCCETITDGSHFSPETTSEGKYYITVRDVGKDSIDFDNAPKISVEDYNTLKRNGCEPKKGDVLLSKDGTIGKCIIVNGTDFVILSSLGLLRPNNLIESEYLRYYLLSDINVKQMYSHIRGSAIKRLTISIIKELLLICPPLNEQEDIINYLNPKISRINNTINKIQDNINLLEEYKTSLIHHVVTGKIDVRGEEI